MASTLDHLKKSPLDCGNHITATLCVCCMLGYSGKWHHQSVGKFTVVYNVNIHAMTKIFGACVLLSLKNSFINTYLVVHWHILGNGISTWPLQKKSPLVCGKSHYRLSVSILHGWIFWEMASALCWKIHCCVQCAHLLFNGNNTCCLCLVVITLQLLFVYTCTHGYSGKWHNQSLWCIQCTFTMQWQHQLLPVSCFYWKIHL